jgi:hypothetical protein
MARAEVVGVTATEGEAEPFVEDLDHSLISFFLRS